MLRVCPLWGGPEREPAQPGNPPGRKRSWRQRDEGIRKKELDWEPTMQRSKFKVDSGGLVQIPVDVSGDDEGQTKPAWARASCNGLGACRRALAWLAEPHNPYSNCAVNTARYRYCSCCDGSRMAGCGSFLSCLQRHYSNGKSVQQHRLLLFLVGCGAGASANAGAGAGLGCSRGHARGRI